MSLQGIVLINANILILFTVQKFFDIKWLKKNKLKYSLYIRNFTKVPIITTLI